MDMEVKPDLVLSDRIVSEDPYMLHGFVVRVSVDGGVATLYDGTSPDAEKSLGGFPALVNQPTVVMFPLGIPLRRGLYVDLGSNVTSVLVIGHQLWNTKS